jgi:hypothetical protein
MYTLAQLALFDRCLFPDDFYNALLKHGCQPTLAMFIRSWLIEGKGKRGIVSVYQEWVETSSDGRPLAATIDAILQEFFEGKN